MDDKICVWPNGDWCYYGDLEEYLDTNSDDYEVMSINDPEARQFIENPPMGW